MIFNMRSATISESTVSSGDIGSPLDFHYTGNAVFLGDLYTDWSISFLTEGYFTLNSLGNTQSIDIFLVGGGGNGGTYDYYEDGVYGTGTNFVGGGGGGSAYTETKRGITIVPGTYFIDIAEAEGTTSAFGYEAAGGSAGTNDSGHGSYAQKGIGGVGKRTGGRGRSQSSGSAGSDGEYAFDEVGFSHALGTSYKFAASGGGGTGLGGGNVYGSSGGKGGTSGGGTGGKYKKDGTSAAANSGSGAGGAGANGGSYGIGGSGIVIIRNARTL